MCCYCVGEEWQQWDVFPPFLFVNLPCRGLLCLRFPRRRGSHFGKALAKNFCHAHNNRQEQGSLPAIHSPVHLPVHCLYTESVYPNRKFSCYFKRLPLRTLRAAGLRGKSEQSGATADIAGAAPPEHREGISGLLKVYGHRKSHPI
jgi:hypothetical protein